MKGIREIRQRMKAIKGIGQITRAMELVAVSKMKRAQDLAKNARPYSLLLAEILNALDHYFEKFEHPFFEQRAVKTRGIIVVSTDKGLCGALNTNLFRLITEFTGPIQYIAVGRKASQFLARTKRELVAEFPISDKCRFSEIKPLVEYASQAFLDKKTDTVEIVFPRFVSTLIQTASHEVLLPLIDFRSELETLRKRLTQVPEPIKEDSREMNYEPDPLTFLQAIPPLFLKQEIYQILLESKASEHSSRMVAMKNATDNAKELRKKLNLEYNKARQAAITQEILEIAAATAQAKQFK